MRKNSFSGIALVLLLGAGCGSPIGRARPTALPTRPPNLSWDGSIGALLNDRCASCHGQVAGNHPGQLSAAELARVTEWLKWGAPEK